MSWSDPCARCDSHRADCSCDEGYLACTPPVEINCEKTFTDNQVLAMLVDAVMTAMGDEWVPQEDELFKSFLEGYGLLELFNTGYKLN